jgi:AcrR family transcriptional regulator
MNNAQRSTITRSAILDAATRLFARDGYDTTGVAEICETAGVSKGAFYYHFESKEAVFLELIDSWLKALEATLQEVTAKAETVPDGLLDMAGMVQQVFENNRQFMGLFLELWTHASRNEKVRLATLAPYRRYQDIFASLIQRGIDEGTIAPVDPAAAGQMLLSLSSGLFLQASLEPTGTDWGRILQESINIFLNGLKKEGKYNDSGYRSNGTFR